MVNKRTIITGIFVVFAILAISLYTGQLTQSSEGSTSNAKVPPAILLETTSTDPYGDIRTFELSENDGNVICDKPPKDNKYGGIGNSENNPPKGTTIAESKIGNRVTATGICGTYWYISGWWFNASEMANLPYDTIMYGISPYTTLEGPEGNNYDDGPVVPVPQVATFALFAIGILTFVVWVRIKNK